MTRRVVSMPEVDVMIQSTNSATLLTCGTTSTFGLESLADDCQPSLPFTLRSSLETPIARKDCATLVIKLSAQVVSCVCVKVPCSSVRAVRNATRSASNYVLLVHISSRY